jgi:arginine decarboxylase-like protein
VGDTLAWARYARSELHESFRQLVQARVKETLLAAAEGEDLINRYEDKIGAYTYLDPNCSNGVQ